MAMIGSRPAGGTVGADFPCIRERQVLKMPHRALLSEVRPVSCPLKGGMPRAALQRKYEGQAQGACNLSGTAEERILFRLMYSWDGIFYAMEGVYESSDRRVETQV